MESTNTKNEIVADSSIIPTNGISDSSVKLEVVPVVKEEINKTDDYCIGVVPLPAAALVTRVEKIYAPPADSSDPPVILEMQTLTVSSTNSAANGKPHADEVANKEHKEFLEGVTIEGEGQYQIMEVDDVDEEAVSEEKPNIGQKQQKQKIKIEEFQKPPTPKTDVNIVKPNPSSIKLTREEERAVALEQMELLKSALTTRKTTRKNEKQSKQEKVLEAKAVAKKKADQDLMDTLSADWTDDDESATSNRNAAKVNAKSSSSVKKEEPLKCRPISRRRPVTIPPGIALQKTEASTSGDALPGVKKRRVIKRRIIWDPDVPETHLSFAEFARSSNTVNTVVKNSVVEMNVGSDEEFPKKAMKTEIKKVDKKKAVPVVKQSTITRSSKAGLKIQKSKITPTTLPLPPMPRQQFSGLTKNTVNIYC